MRDELDSHPVALAVDTTNGAPIALPNSDRSWLSAHRQCRRVKAERCIGERLQLFQQRSAVAMRQARNGRRPGWSGGRDGNASHFPSRQAIPPDLNML
ncbi:MAG TPA: hypothetical protein VFW46_22485 [Stellaceae bacterium]|nr:hypothetical protein [Stellaceae bacterium]